MILGSGTRSACSPQIPHEQGAWSGSSLVMQQVKDLVLSLPATAQVAAVVWV